MKFNSQICTSREQSERLLALGLKPETADMYWGEKWGLKDGEVEPYFTGEYIVCVKQPNMWIDCQSTIPAWSLHRLLSIIEYDDGFVDISIREGRYSIHYGYDDGWYDNLYDAVISSIEALIEEGYFPKEYVQHSENTREEGR